MMTPGGQVLHTYEFGEDGSTPVLTKPGRPTQNYNSNVCIADNYEIATNNNRVVHQKETMDFMHILHYRIQEKKEEI